MLVFNIGPTYARDVNKTTRIAQRNSLETTLEGRRQTKRADLTERKTTPDHRKLQRMSFSPLPPPPGVCLLVPTSGYRSPAHCVSSCPRTAVYCVVCCGKCQ